MNKKGHRATLRASQPGNTNALKSGIHSERVRATVAAEIMERLVPDPSGFLTRDKLERYAARRAVVDLLLGDIAERGVSDRDGNPRRQLVDLRKYLNDCELLAAEVLESVTPDAESEGEGTEPKSWSNEKAKAVLIEIAENPKERGAPRIQAIRELRDYCKPEFDREFYEELNAMTDEEIERELQAFRVEVRSGMEPPEWLKDPGYDDEDEEPAKEEDPPDKDEARDVDADEAEEDTGKEQPGDSNWPYLRFLRVKQLPPPRQESGRGGSSCTHTLRKRVLVDSNAREAAEYCSGSISAATPSVSADGGGYRIRNRLTVLASQLAAPREQNTDRHPPCAATLSRQSTRERLLNRLQAPRPLQPRLAACLVKRGYRCRA